MLKYGFFDSVEGDRVYSAEDFSTFYEGLLSDGVIRGVASELKVTPGEGMSVMVGTGKAISGGKWVRNTEPYKLDLAEADSYYDRIDMIVVRTDYTGRTVNLAVKMGTPAQFEQEPAPQDTEHVKELPLACIKVQKNTTTINANNILERRTYATIRNIKNEAVRYISNKSIYMAEKKDFVGENILSRTNYESAIEVISINGSKIIKANLNLGDTKVPKAGEGYLGIVAVMPEEVGQIPHNLPPVITLNAQEGVRFAGYSFDNRDRKIFVFENTGQEKRSLKEITIFYMILDNPEVREY